MNNVIKFNDVILFRDKIIYSVKEKFLSSPITNDKLKNENYFQFYIITVYFVNGTIVEFKNLEKEDATHLEKLIKNGN